MNASKVFSLIPCVVLMHASLALAQQPAPGPQPFFRGYMTGAAGASFADQKAATFAIEIGEHITPRTQAYVAFTYVDDLLTDRARNDLNELAVVLERVSGTPWEFFARDRGLAFTGGAKYLLSQGPSLRPYVGGGPGVLNLSRSITERDLGDVSDPVIVVFGAPDGMIEASKESTFKPMAEFVAGVGIAAGRAYVDIGYRFRRVFRSREDFSFSQFGVGVGMRF
jgi:opacity protein-like surface antigen